MKETLEKPELSEPPAAAEDLFDEPKEKVAVILKDAGEINSTLLAKASNARLLEAPDWSAYARQPFPHQVEGIEWMLRLMNAALSDDHDDLYRLQGSLLADDMGLGKTYMSLVAIGEYLAAQRRSEKPQNQSW